MCCFVLLYQNKLYLYNMKTENMINLIVSREELLKIAKEHNVLTVFEHSHHTIHCIRTLIRLNFEEPEQRKAHKIIDENNLWLGDGQRMRFDGSTNFVHLLKEINEKNNTNF